jgi:hypothetical protein
MPWRGHPKRLQSAMKSLFERRKYECHGNVAERVDHAHVVSRSRRALVTAMSVAVIGAGVSTQTVFSHEAEAVSVYSSSISLDEPFTGTTLNNASHWISMAGGTLTEWPCLLAATTVLPVSTGNVEACVNQNGSVVNDGEGALRLTRRRALNNPNTVAGSMLYSQALSASEGIDISFLIRSEGGQVADGMSFFLKDGANTLNSIGAAGGSMGYGMSHTLSPADLSTVNGNGVPGALFGVGFDRYGNFSWNGVGGFGCPSRGTHTNQGSPPSTAKNQLVLRGPDTSLTSPQDGSSGYCFLRGTTVTYSDTDFQRVRVKVEPYTPGQPTTLSVYLASHVTPDLLPVTPTLTEIITLNASSFKFGFSAATGWWSNNHDLRGLMIRPSGPSVSALSSSATTGSGTGPTSGGTVLTIDGSNFVAGAAVFIDGQACTNVTIAAGGTQLTCTTPPGSPGTKQVVITNPNGGPGYGTFTYVNPAPTVSVISPSSGTVDGGNTVTVSGTGFVTGATVTIGGQQCTSVVVVSSSSLTCIAPQGVLGTSEDVIVTNVGGASGNGVGLYSYVNTPLIPSTTTTTTTSLPTTNVSEASLEAVTGTPLPQPRVLPTTGRAVVSTTSLAIVVLLLASLVMFVRRRVDADCKTCLNHGV